MKKEFLKSIYLSLFTIILGFGFKIFLANILSKESLTLYYTTIDIFTLFLLILVGFRSSMVIAYSKTKDALGILNILRVSVLFILLMVWTFAIPYVKHSVNVDISYWYLVTLAIAMSLYNYLNNQIAMYRLYKISNHVMLLESIFTIIWFIIAFYIFNVRDLQSLFISTTMAIIFVSIYIVIKRNSLIESTPIKKIDINKDRKEFIKNSIISTIEFSSGLVIIYLTVFILMKYFSNSDLGNFQVVVKPIFTYMLMLFVFPIFRFVLPQLSIHIAKKEIKDILEIRNWIYKYSIMVYVTTLIIFILFLKDIIGTIFPKEYYMSYLMLTHLIFFFIFITLNAYHISFIKAYGKFQQALFVRIFGIVIFLLSFYSIYFFKKNEISVILALAFSYVGMFLISLMLSNRLLRKLEEESKRS